MRSELAWLEWKVQSISKTKRKHFIYTAKEFGFCLRGSGGAFEGSASSSKVVRRKKVLGLAAVKRFWDKGTGKSGDRPIWGN